jgi:fluoroacetyl-CoA thioesterase
MALTLGTKGEATTIVADDNTADTFGAGEVKVFATPMMIGLMENACWRAVADQLDEGYVTVGTLVHVRHLASTPIGQKVRATAELISIDGRRLLFHVEAYDEHQKIGEGEHERFIVHLERFLQKQQK